MNIAEFMDSLTAPQQTFVIIVVLAVIWGITSPYFALSHLKGIERELFRIRKALEEKKK